MKVTSPSLSLILVCCLLATPAAMGQRPSPPAPTTQTPPASPTAPAQTPQDSSPDDEVVRITSNLVQVDVVVTDRDNRQVTDLRADELEIYEDGRPQKMTNFSYVAGDTAAAPTPPPPVAPATKPADRRAPPVPPVRLRPEQVRRTIALVVDDLGASFESIASIRHALKKYVDEQMQPGDLVAVMRTSAGMGALQQFTTDKRQLYAAIERVRWNAFGRGRIGAFAPLEADPFGGTRPAGAPETNDSRPRMGNSSDRDERSGARRVADDMDEFREQIFSVGTLGALNFIVNGLRRLPGRKAVVLFSDGIEIFNRDNESSDRIIAALRRLTDLANRASVVVYTIDARGLQTLGLTASDDTSSMSPREVERELSNRRSAFFESQSGLIYLAQQTGGFAVRNNNDIAGGVRRVLEDQKGYYLIGYRPDDATFDTVAGRRRFHHLTAKVKRPGLKVRLRSGFYGITDEEAHPVMRTRDEQLLAALTSPFTTGGVRLRLTSLFTNEEKQGSYMRSLLHIDGRDFSFTDEPEGWHKAVFDIVAVAYGDNGRVLEQVNRTPTMRVRGESYEAVLKNGLTLTLDVPVKKPGAYQLRVAVRDAASERVGSANQFIEVPNLGKERLALSGLVVASDDPDGKASAKTKTSADSDGQTQTGEGDPLVGAAVRRFRRGGILDYYFHIYNAKLDRATGRPQLQTQARLFRDGQLVFAGQPIPFEVGQQQDMKRLLAGARMRLGTKLEPGEYMLQVIVIDALAKEKQRLATQWIDFEIVG